MTRRHRLSPVAGVYVVQGPNGIYIGESRDCFDRNSRLTALGVCWGIVREMPDSTTSERRLAETEIADLWAARGWALCSQNTPDHLRIAHMRKATGPRSAETRARISASGKGRHFTDKQRAANERRRGNKTGPISQERRAKIIAAYSTAEVRERHLSACRQAWVARRAAMGAKNI